MKTMEKSEFEKLNAFGTGRDNTAYARYFIGRSYLNPLTKPQDGLAMSNVTFEPGCRNNWHIHHATAGGGQILICTAGEGWYQEEGKAPVSLKPGMVVAIPADVKHWHGAKADSWFSHIAFEIPGENGSTEWCEPVTDEVYNAVKRKCKTAGKSARRFLLRVFHVSAAPPKPRKARDIRQRPADGNGQPDPRHAHDT